MVSVARAKATDDIARRIASLRGGMALISKTMDRSRTAVAEGQSAIGDAARTMEGIAAQVGNVSHKMRDISDILGQQKGASAEIGRSVEHVAGTAAENEALLFTMSDKLHDSNTSLTANAADWFTADSHRALCEMAKIDHVLFKKRFVDVLMGRAQWSPAEVPDHHGCRLGKWHDSVDIPEVTALPAFTALVAPHQRVHAAARTALQAHAVGDSTAALHALEAMNAAGHEVLARLDELCRVLFERSAELDRRKSASPAPAPRHGGACCGQGQSGGLAAFAAH